MKYQLFLFHFTDTKGRPEPSFLISPNDPKEFQDFLKFCDHGEASEKSVKEYWKGKQPIQINKLSEVRPQYYHRVCTSLAMHLPELTVESFFQTELPRCVVCNLSEIPATVASTKDDVISWLCQECSTSRDEFLKTQSTILDTIGWAARRARQFSGKA